MKLKLKKMKKPTSPRIFDSSRLKDVAIKEAFSIELSNRFHALSEMPADDVDDYCLKVSETFIKTGEETLGYKEKTRKPWISDNSWKLILDRKDTKQKLLGCQDEKKEDLQ